ncbi:hypothetical protein ASZ90_010865 [hydrocarbon metagenome]|uniref:Uncharacterized protein n=1 Tax=hydrocarbon metagenome TaxID=938273 RepID=A0A0W8FEV0_9ZZZZ
MRHLHRTNPGFVRHGINPMSGDEAVSLHITESACLLPGSRECSLAALLCCFCRGDGYIPVTGEAAEAIAAGLLPHERNKRVERDPDAGIRCICSMRYGVWCL